MPWIFGNKKVDVGDVTVGDFPTNYPSTQANTDATTSITRLTDILGEAGDIDTVVGELLTGQGAADPGVSLPGGTGSLGWLSHIFDLLFNVETGASTLKTDANKVLGATSVVSSVATSTTSATLVSSNTSRMMVIVSNNSAGSVLYVKYGATASAASYTIALQPGGTIVEDTYNGRIDGVLAAGTDSSKVTEVTP